MSKAHSAISMIREAPPSLSGTMVRIVAGGSAAMNGITAFGVLGCALGSGDAVYQL